MENTIESRYLLNEYITREKKRIFVENTEYELTMYQGNHSNEYLLCEMKDGKVEGHCQLFNRGILSLAWVMKNGKRIGDITKYENGKASQKESWNSILGTNDRRIIENCKEGLIMIIQHRCEREENGGDRVIYRGGFDEERNRHGYGIEYDTENGKEKIEGYWVKDKLSQIIREFDADKNEMIEYAAKHNVEIINRIPLYIGGYCIQNGKYVRNGKGYVIDQGSGMAVRESEWENGIEKEGGMDLYDGWYVKDMGKSIRSVLKNEMNTQPIIIAPVKRVEVHNRNELNEMDLDVTDLVISSNCCNDVLMLNVISYQLLQSISIGDYCFESVKTFKIEGLNRLKTLKIGENSFTNRADCYGKDESKSFHILNCGSLESIEIGKMSFSDFAGEFELKNLPQLQSIQIGKTGTIDTCEGYSYNFRHSSFVIRGIDMILNIWVMHRSSKSAIHYIR